MINLVKKYSYPLKAIGKLTAWLLALIGLFFVSVAFEWSSFTTAVVMVLIIAYVMTWYSALSDTDMKKTI